VLNWLKVGELPIVPPPVAVETRCVSALAQQRRASDPDCASG
jgi:hypothetical protein